MFSDFGDCYCIYRACELVPFFVLTTISYCLTVVVFISYLPYLSILPISLLFFTGILTGYYGGKQRGMPCFNCGPSSLLSSDFFTTLKESSSSSRGFYLWNTMVSFLIASTWISVMCILIPDRLTHDAEPPGAWNLASLLLLGRECCNRRLEILALPRLA